MFIKIFTDQLDNFIKNRTVLKNKHSYLYIYNDFILNSYEYTACDAIKIIVNEIKDQKEYQQHISIDWITDANTMSDFFVSTSFQSEIYKQKGFDLKMPETKKETHKCSCSIRDLMMYGCKCKGI